MKSDIKKEDDNKIPKTIAEFERQKKLDIQKYNCYQVTNPKYYCNNKQCITKKTDIFLIDFPFAAKSWLQDFMCFGFKFELPVKYKKESAKKNLFTLSISKIL